MPVYDGYWWLAGSWADWYSFFNNGPGRGTVGVPHAQVDDVHSLGAGFVPHTVYFLEQVRGQGL